MLTKKTIFIIPGFGEFPYTMYEQFPGLMTKNKKGQYVLKNKNIEIPLLFSLQARK